MLRCRSGSEGKLTMNKTGERPTLEVDIAECLSEANYISEGYGMVLVSIEGK
jgi:hypothetical protein